MFFFPRGIIELEFHDDFMMDDHITVVLINCRRTQRSSLQMVNCMISITNGSVTDGAEPPKQIENSRPVIKIIAMENVPFTDYLPSKSGDFP